MKILGESFFNRDTRMVAKELLGAYLVREAGSKQTRVMVVETEAYDGPRDKASHASRGKTRRNEPMFGRPGVFYVYLCYGVHEMLNIVTREEGYPAAVLIRGVRLDNGILLNGPGRVSRALAVDRKINAQLASTTTGLWFESTTRESFGRTKISALPRVGVAYAGPFWAGKKWRYTLAERPKKIDKIGLRR